MYLMEGTKWLTLHSLHYEFILNNEWDITHSFQMREYIKDTPSNSLTESKRWIYGTVQNIAELGRTWHNFLNFLTHSLSKKNGFMELCRTWQNLAEICTTLQNCAELFATLHNFVQMCTTLLMDFFRASLIVTYIFSLSETPGKKWFEWYVRKFRFLSSVKPTTLVSPAWPQLWGHNNT